MFIFFVYSGAFFSDSQFAFSHCFLSIAFRDYYYYFRLLRSFVFSFFFDCYHFFFPLLLLCIFPLALFSIILFQLSCSSAFFIDIYVASFLVFFFVCTALFFFFFFFLKVVFTCKRITVNINNTARTLSLFSLFFFAADSVSSGFCVKKRTKLPCSNLH